LIKETHELDTLAACGGTSRREKAQKHNTDLADSHLAANTGLRLRLTDRVKTNEPC